MKIKNGLSSLSNNIDHNKAVQENKKDRLNLIGEGGFHNSNTKKYNFKSFGEGLSFVNSLNYLNSFNSYNSINEHEKESIFIIITI